MLAFFHEAAYMGSDSAESMDFCASRSRIWRNGAGLVAERQHIIIHAGFHRCASTAVQDLLRARRPVIEASGTALLLREDLEGWLAGRQLRLLYRHKAGSLPSAVRFALAKSMLRRTGAARVLISEENLIGMMPGVAETRFYPHFRAFLKAVKLLSQDFDISLRFITRRPDRFLESAYAFRVVRGLRMPFPAFLEAVGQDAADWSRLAAEVEAAGLLGLTRFACLEAWGQENPGAAALAFLGHADAADGDLKFSGNRRRTADELQAVVGEGVEVGFTDAGRQAFLNRHADAMKAFLVSPMVDAAADPWGL